jgi:hypothetical protein
MSPEPWYRRLLEIPAEARPCLGLHANRPPHPSRFSFGLPLILFCEQSSHQCREAFLLMFGPGKEMFRNVHMCLDDWPKPGNGTTFLFWAVFWGALHGKTIDRSAQLA